MTLWIFSYFLNKLGVSVAAVYKVHTGSTFTKKSKVTLTVMKNLKYFELVHQDKIHTHTEHKKKLHTSFLITHLYIIQNIYCMSSKYTRNHKTEHRAKKPL